MPRKEKEKPTCSDGRFDVKVTVGHDANGKVIYKHFYSYISREDAKKQALLYKPEEKKLDTAFSEFIYYWLEVYKEHTVKEHTYLYSYMTNVDNYLVPYFSDRSMRNHTIRYSALLHRAQIPCSFHT